MNHKIPQPMFDVRPVQATGDLDLEKIKKIKNCVDLRGVVIRKREIQETRTEKKFDYRSNFKNIEEKPNSSVFIELVEALKKESDFDENFAEDYIKEVKLIPSDFTGSEDLILEDLPSREEILAELARIDKEEDELKEKIFKQKKNIISFLGFAFLSLVLGSSIWGLGWIGEGFLVKEKVLGSSWQAYQSLLGAKKSLKEINFNAAAENFSLAQENFLEAQEEIKKLGETALGILEQLPGGSLLSSGRHLLETGQELSQAGKNLSIVLNLLSENLFDFQHWEFVSFDGSIQNPDKKSPTEVIALAQGNLKLAFQSLTKAEHSLNQVEIEALPENLKEKTLFLKKRLPLVVRFFQAFLDYSEISLKVLGHFSPKEYLLLFQNNSEIRATGGFIGTYGLLTLDQGRVKRLFIDGVFNADGQLLEKVIPPRPIQKISTAWSMHDANWFADFPTSAQKVAWFYEKTGGPTVDGVIALTPVVIERLLKITGPIKMPEYGVVLDSDNFVKVIQYKVEVDYDKILNRPKKILADFAPKFIQSLKDLPLEKQKEVIQVILDCLKEKHILIYLADEDLEKVIKEFGWGGELISTEKDYLSVVSSNINGFKTDRVIEEKINLQTEIKKDGSIIDTLTIIRKHLGGHYDYDWWNRVNANYLRVYLPKGTKLLEAEGHTLEPYAPPIDYEKNGFKSDPLVKEIESKMIIDPETGTQIFEENNKTVFGNWVYVSPGETVKVTYRYQLPFKIDFNKPSDSYSLLVQKQAGTLGSQFTYTLKFPNDWQVSWQYPNQGQLEAGHWSLKTDLSLDRFFGVTFGF